MKTMRKNLKDIKVRVPNGTLLIYIGSYVNPHMKVLFN